MLQSTGNPADSSAYPNADESALSIRHTFATNFLQSNPGKLVDLSVLLGHESVNTTAVYLRASEDLALGVEGSGLNVFGE